MRRNGKLIQIQTECTPHPDPMVVSVAILDGQTIMKEAKAVPPGSDRQSMMRLIREQHSIVERKVAEQAEQSEDDEAASSGSRLAQFNRLFEQGLDAYMSGAYEQAVEVWQEAVALDPTSKVVAVNLDIARKKLRSSGRA